MWGVSSISETKKKDQCQDFWTLHAAEDLSRIKSSTAGAAGGRLNSTQVFSPYEVLKNLDSGAAVSFLGLEIKNPYRYD